MKVCIVGASGKLGQYTVQHALDRGYEVEYASNPVVDSQLAEKLQAFSPMPASNSGITDPIAREIAPWFKDGIAPLNWFWEPEITTEIENQVQALVKGEAQPKAAADAVQAKADQLRREGRSYFN